MLVYRWIEPGPDGRFQTTEPGHGHVAATFPVIDRAGQQVDTVAWLPARPGAWWTAAGIETVLGLPAIHAAEWSGAPLRLLLTPDAWHQAKGQGAVILDWTRSGEIFDALCGVSRVVADTDALGKRLVAALKEATRPRFRVAVAKPQQAPRQAATVSRAA